VNVVLSAFEIEETLFALGGGHFMISPNEVESQDSFVRSGGSPPATEPRNLAWFRGRSAPVVRKFTRFATSFPTIAYDIKLSTHCEDVPKERYCYCCECVDLRNAPVPASSFLDEMLRAGFTLQRQVDSHLREDISFLLGRINSLPDAPIIQDSEQFMFNRAINDLRAEHRTRPAINRGKLTQIFESESSAWLPWRIERSSAPTFGTLGSCYSIRQRAEKPFDRKQSQSIENTKRYVHRSGKVVTPIWVASKPPTQYTNEPIVMLGEMGLHPDEIYSQGITRAVVRGKETLVTDWWATKYKSGWQGYVPKSSYKIILKRGERLRDEFFEPTQNQMISWLERYTSNGKFKYVRRERFSKTLPKWLFKNQTDEASGVSQAFDLKELEHDFNNVFEDGTCVEPGEAEEDPEWRSKTGEVSEDHEITPPAPGRPWSKDSEFVRELNRILPKGYSKLSVYSCGRKEGDPPIQVPQLAAARDLDPNTFTVEPRLWICKTFQVPLCVVKPSKASDVGENTHSDRGYSEKTLELTNRRLTLGSLAPITLEEQKYAEQLLRTSVDYDLEQHDSLRHFYEYGYRYYPSHFPASKDGRFTPTVFESVRSTSKDKSDEVPTLRDAWDDAIRNTFGHMIEGTPTDGFYVVYKISLMSELRVYPVLTRFATSDEESGESPAPFGLHDMYAEIRKAVGGMRVRAKKPATVGDNLRSILRAGGARHVRFAWDDIRGLTYVVSS
jgi:hypothetical protein